MDTCFKRGTACTLLQRREAERMARAVNMGTVESPWISGIFATLRPALLPGRVDIWAVWRIWRAAPTSTARVGTSPADRRRTRG